MTDHSIHGTPITLGPYTYDILHIAMSYHEPPSFLTRIQQTSGGALKVAITILMEMHFRVIVADDSRYISWAHYMTMPNIRTHSDKR